jgi:hypothetical protein
VYQVRHTAGLNPKAFQARYTRAGPTYGAGLTAVKPLKPLENWLLQVRSYLYLGKFVWCHHSRASWRFLLCLFVGWQLGCCLPPGWCIRSS